MRHRSGDLSRALIPMNDVKKLSTLPTTTPLPNSINEMIGGKFIGTIINLGRGLIKERHRVSERQEIDSIDQHYQLAE